MAVISKGTTFASGDQVTALSLNNLADNATFASGAVDSVSTQLSSGSIIVKDGGVSTAKIADSAVTAAKIASDALAASYPIGSIYMNASDATNPATLLGFGTWVAFGAGKVPVGIDSGDTDFDVAEETGGAKTHTLTQAEMEHNHQWNNRDTSGTFTDNYIKMEFASQSGSDNTFDSSGNATSYTNSFELRQDTYTAPNRGLTDGTVSPHNNLQPYIVVHMWKRTA